MDAWYFIDLSSLWQGVSNLIPSFYVNVIAHQWSKPSAGLTSLLKNIVDNGGKCYHKHVTHCRAEFILGNNALIFSMVSHKEMKKAVEIIPHGSQGLIYPARQIPWMLMPNARSQGISSHGFHVGLLKYSGFGNTNINKLIIHKMWVIQCVVSLTQVHHSMYKGVKF